jgi:tetratricopeptide (TPR) repeat protein
MEQGHPLPAPELAPVLDALGLEFLSGFLEVELSRHPENLGALVELGHVYTRARQYEKGLAVDREIVRRCPEDPTARYNLACSLALTGEPEVAVTELERAIELGYDDAEHLLADEDLASLRERPRFRALVESLGKVPPKEPG